MANLKISQLTEDTAPTGDDLTVTVNDPSGTPATKKVSLNNFLRTIFTSLSLTGDISPAQITADQDDYDPTGLADAVVLRLSSDASRNITSIAGGADGRILILFNVGSFDIVLTDDDGATGTAGNRFALVSDVTLQPKQCAIIQYDSTSSRWRLLAGAGTSAGTGDIKSDGSVPFAADQSMGSHKLTNVTDPGSAQDAATKAYVDAQISGGGPPTGSAGGDLSGTYPNPTLADDVVDAAALAPADVNAQTGTTYTLQASDNNKVVTLSNASAITVTVPSGLGAGFSCLCVQLGAGQVTFSPSSTTVNNRQSHTKIAGQYGVVSLAAYVSDTFVLGGDTAA